jgi:dTDP-4-amino-4,6-dideoxygalactose transaminase
MRVDPAEVAPLIRRETRAIYLTHYVGFPGPADALRELCDRRGLYFIEDCALALLSRDGARPLGALGDAAIFCLYKTLPTPNGGAVLVRRGAPLEPEGAAPPLASTGAHLASSLLRSAEIGGGALGRGVRRLVRAVGNAAAAAAEVERVPTGTDHFNPAHAHLLMSQLSRVVISAQDFPGIVARRRENYHRLSEALRDLAPPIIPELKEGVCPLFYPFVTPRKRAVFHYLRARSVEAVDFWGLYHPAAPPKAFPEVDELRRTVLELPCHQDLDGDAVTRIIDLTRRAAREVG